MDPPTRVGDGDLRETTKDVRCQLTKHHRENGRVLRDVWNRHGRISGANLPMCFPKLGSSWAGLGPGSLSEQIVTDKNELSSPPTAC